MCYCIAKAHSRRIEGTPLGDYKSTVTDASPPRRSRRVPGTKTTSFWPLRSADKNVEL